MLTKYVFTYLSTMGWNKVKEPSLYLRLARGQIIGFILFTQSINAK